MICRFASRNRIFVDWCNLSFENFYKTSQKWRHWNCVTLLFFYDFCYKLNYQLVGKRMNFLFRSMRHLVSIKYFRARNKSKLFAHMGPCFLYSCVPFLILFWEWMYNMWKTTLNNMNLASVCMYILSLFLYFIVLFLDTSTHTW